MRRKAKLFCNLLGILLFFAGCAKTEATLEAGIPSEKEMTLEAESNTGSGISVPAEPVVPEGENEQAGYSVWNAYWNLEGVETQTEELAEYIRNVNFFAAYFDQHDNVFIPSSSLAFYEQNRDTYRKNGWNCYLTVVNDQILADGTSSLKSTDLLYRLLTHEEIYTAHAEELLALVMEHGYDGLEIDYENIRKDNILWEYFMNFADYLHSRCEEEGILLRILLETNIEPENIPWVDGPSYVVMCYNLYGSHSGPGPKADRTFLEDIMEKMKNVPGKIDYALANGGFDWSDNGTVKSLTASQAKQLEEAAGVTAKRDDASDAKYFSYEDANGIRHEVWYADEDTMQSWMTWLQANDNWDYSIWRLGE